jgi:acyl-CoA synthetase (AMP-forming)/AMP-acid ligase II
MAQSAPERPAIIAPRRGFGGVRWESVTFAELDARSNAYAAGLQEIGISRGVRTVLMVPPDIEFFALVFGLFKVGAVLVLIDPGIARSALISCLEEVEAEAFIGVPKAHLARLLFPRAFRKVRTHVTVGRRLGWGGHALSSVAKKGEAKLALAAANGKANAAQVMIDPREGETAAILFTSGSTGAPKGVVYTHAMFDAQVRGIRATYGIEPGEIDLPTFPLFALFDPALGMTAVLPDMDFRFPGRADPERLVSAMTTHNCTNMFGSPALLDNLGRYCVEQGVTLPKLRRVLSAGAPVRTDILERMAKTLSADAQVFTPFGATESLPVASIGSHEVLTDTRHGTANGKGICVGRPVDNAVVRIIKITDEPISNWSDELLVPVGEIGEITVKGPMVTHHYHAREESTRVAKIHDGDHIVHRMGDVGAFDDQGRLWMCGRKGHRVETTQGTLFSVPVEEIMNTHPGVNRTALVGVGARGTQHPVLLVERESQGAAGTGRRGLRDAELLSELHELAKKHSVTQALQDLRIYPERFPTDTRHNAKIEREKLALWAAEHGAAKAEARP